MLTYIILGVIVFFGVVFMIYVFINLCKESRKKR